MGKEPDLSQFNPTRSRKLITNKVRRFFGRILSAEDVEDNTSRIMLVVLEKLPGYDPQRSGLETYISRIVDSSLIDIARENRAVKRGASRGAQSLNATVSDGDGNSCEVWQLLDDSCLRAHRFTEASNRQNEVDLRLDLIAVSDTLSATEQKLVRFIYQGCSAREVAVASEICPATAYRRLKRLLAKLVRLGIYR